KMEMMDKLDLITDSKTAISACNSVVESYQSRLNSINKDVSILIREKDAFFLEKESAERLLTETEKNEEKLNKEYHETEIEYRNSSEKLKKIESELHETGSSLSTEKSKFNLLNDMEKSYEGYNKSVKAVLYANDNRLLENVRVYGTVADIVKVDEKYETAVEMAIGGAMQNIITEDEDDAKAVIQYLRKGNRGRATMMPVSSMKPRWVEDNVLHSMSKMKGFVDTCDRLVSCEDRFSNIIRNLLGRIVVAADYDSAVLMAKAYSYTYRIVTLDGDILQTGGSITGGSVNKVTTSLLSRKRLLSELETTIVKLESKYRSLTSGKQSVSENVAKCKEKMEQLNKNKRDMELERIKYENRLESLLEKLESHAFKIENAKDEKEQFKKEIEKNEAELKELHEKLSGIEKEIDDIKRVIVEFEGQNKHKRQRKDDLVTDITDYKVSVSSIRESIESINNNLQDSERSVQVLLNGINQKNEEITKNQEKIKNVQLELTQLNNDIKGLTEKMTGANLAVVKLDEEKKNIKLEIEEARKATETGNKNILLFKEEENRLNVRSTKIQSDMDALKSRMFDEYEMTFAQAMNIQTQTEEDISPKKISALKNQINSLGSVHVGAIQEYTETKSRYDFLTKQQTEMENAKEKLKRVVYEMNSVMKTKFSEKLKEINKNFKKVFYELFDGGRAELALADNENILESDIEVFVQPPGKNLQNMMLLSGGERSLSAIALLFSIMMLKPTPFCILDEIEAALDDVNVYRFIDYLKTLSDKTQFILITHRKGTMEGSDLLYGVTMQEHGVSHVVAIDAEQIEKTG
ncbi:MAG TPA: chromosome segregation protein SMC, partial [Clostridiales bacterium]|nr:chromosome segregation protein SMC [Clostridiales bacterium]